MARTLAERLRAHEQSKARLAEAEAKLKLDERKQRTRRLVEAGALVEKCGLLDLDSNALYGALLSLRDGADDKAHVEKWAALGGRTFAREASGEARSQITSGGEFFRESGKGLIACLMAHMLWDPSRAPRQKTLRELRRLLVLPEDEMREQLKQVHQTSHSSMARDLAGTLKGLVAETFSGVYANANKDTRWLSTPAYADLVSGSTFPTRKLAQGELTVFVQIPLGVLKSTPALGRVVVGSLLNAAYEADGRVRGRILFLLDEVARLGYMQVLEQARDAGRKYGITLLLLYQSLGQLAEQWDREGKQAWYDSTSWRLFAAVQDPDTAKELSAMCGEHGVVATSLGESAGTQGRMSGGASASSGRSESGPGGGNGRAVRTLWERTHEAQAGRVMRLANRTRDDLLTITGADVEEAARAAAEAPV